MANKSGFPRSQVTLNRDGGVGQGGATRQRLCELCGGILVGPQHLTGGAACRLRAAVMRIATAWWLIGKGVG